MRRVCNRRRPAATIGAALLVGALLDAPVWAEPKRLEIPAGPAAECLMQLGREADVTIIFDYTAANEHRSNAVSGSMDVESALHTMLDGTGLQFEFNDPTTIAVRVVRKTPARSGDSRATSEVVVPGVRPLQDVKIPAHTFALRTTVADLEKRGVVTIEEFASLLPQNFGGGATEDTAYGREALTNPALGTGMNLYGLGSRATLILVDGRRLAPSGTAGTFTDISNLPLSAIDHIEVLSDGASTLYGADAIGGVVNFALRGDPATWESKANIGLRTSGSLGESLFQQSLGQAWDGGAGLFCIEYYTRDPVWASARTLATSDLVPFGGFNWGTPAGKPATLVDSKGSVWAIPSGQNGVGLKASDLIPGQLNLHDRYQGTTVFPEQERLSAVLTARQKMIDNLSIYFDGLASRRRVWSQGPELTASLTVPANNPWYVNPGSGDAVTLLYGFGKDFGPTTLRGRVDSGQLTTGFDVETSADWNTTGYIGYAFERQRDAVGGLVDFAKLQAAVDSDLPNTAFNPFGDGKDTRQPVLDSIAQTGHYSVKSVLTSLNVTTSGPTLRLPAGPLVLNLGGEYRRQAFSLSVYPSDLTRTPQADRSRTTGSVFTAAQVPIIGAHKELDRTILTLSSGVRYEHYSDAGNGVAPQIGATFSPLRGLTFRASWARLFRPPNLPDLNESTNLSALFTLADPKSRSGFTSALTWSGSNAGLRPERARSSTLSISWTPANHPNLALDLTYFNISFNDRITQIDLPLDVLENPGLSYLVDRDVSATERTRVCNSSQFVGSLQDCLQSPIGAIVDLRLRNVQTLVTDGFDATIRYEVNSPIGRLKLGLESNYILRYAQADAPAAALANLRNTTHNPIGLHVHGLLEWDWRRLWVTAEANHQGNYRNLVIDPSQHPDIQSVRTWTTVNAVIGYAIATEWALEHGQARISFSAKNLFNTSPPFVNNSLGIGYDQENGDLLGRRLGVGLQLRW
jgi:iron complex outermembrane receptor protein